ncbi:DUF3617 domain-containing protein [Erythrobacter sp. QSSC1-22B]|uniref:DUF3617 domain-containing protein n=1 Tax=Erythrobacter sp. QSSC1-22B TaxID=1860125 RepID=UPI00143BE7FF|nr:DUF3617 domain-containing protein [Erythrobacter sp. QSSC1-22B]
MKLFVVAAPLALVALIGCGEPEADSVDPGEATAGGISQAEVAERARDTIQPQPGQYRAVMEVLEVDIPGAPEGSGDMLRQMMDGQSHEYCLTQEDVDKGYEEMARQSQDGDCTFDRFDVDGGAIDALMTCTGEQSNTMRMAMTGTATPTSSVMNMTMTGDMTGMGESTLRMKATHERVGDCR